ncbi:YheC/YheD family protein [Cohnella pontilimi]|uniref:YheC/YheD family protein n=1 Tax=Cohnella pontilimi TaxID=2564100 RepID=A0A4U0FCJ3_9BACL|nr:YheC/YheD family protein [Cohnella pontilimi]TJY42593.1 YheC/YheD family protein [Cohnella pontilimi]
MASKWDPSKWEIQELYSRHPELRKLLPPMAILTPHSLSKFLHKYKSVYIKGRHEHTGSGIIKAWKTETGYRYVRVKGAPVDVRSIDELYEKVKDGRSARSVLIQKTIDLATMDGRPFSIRVQVMRDRNRVWRYAGMIVKVAGEDSVVTNVRRGGGYAATIEHALARSLGYGPLKTRRVKRKLIDYGYQLVRYAAKKGIRTHEAGLDLGIDRDGNIWVIEANLAYPSYKLFDRLEDKTYYRRVNRLAAEYKLAKRKSR